MASVSDRIFAQMLDCLFIWVYMSLVSMIFFSLSSTIFIDRINEQLFIIICVFLLLPVIFYHLIFEFFFGGASPGKRILKIKVVHADGSSPTFGSYLMRWIMSLLECYMLPGIGLLFIIFNKQGQRLGDMMAGTVVIKNYDFKLHHINLDSFGYVQPNYKPCYPEVASLTVRQAHVVRDTLINNSSNRNYYIDQLTTKLTQYLNIPPLINQNNEIFLNTVLNDYRFYSSTIEI